MKITSDKLMKLHACAEAVEWFNENVGKPIDVIELIERVIDEKSEWYQDIAERHDDRLTPFEWSTWLLVRLLCKNDCVRYAIFSARLVLHLYEEKYPSDSRPRKAIETAEKYLSVIPAAAAANVANAAAYAAAYAAAAVRAADAAAYAAKAAAYAAYAAAYAAADAANADAYAAANATNAAAYATDAAAADAYAAANAKQEMYRKIIGHGCELKGEGDESE